MHPFFYPLKTSENLKGALETNGLKTWMKIIMLNAQAYLTTTQSNIFDEVLPNFYPSAIFAKSSIADIRLGSKYASEA